MVPTKRLGGSIRSDAGEIAISVCRDGWRVGRGGLAMARAGGSALISARRSPTGSTAGRLGTRWAAAALALGLGLAAPGMTGLALADSPDLG